MTAGKIPSRHRKLDPVAERAVTAGRRYRGAMMALATMLAVCVVTTLVIVVIVVLQGPQRSRQTRDLIDKVHSQNIALRDELQALENDINQRKLSEQRIINELKKQIANEDAQVRRYLHDLIDAIRSGRPLSVVTLTPRPASTVTTTSTQVVTTTSSPTRGQGSGGSSSGQTTGSPTPSSSPSCTVVLLNVCVKL